MLFFHGNIQHIFVDYISNLNALMGVSQAMSITNHCYKLDVHGYK